jgi:heat shock protein HtpX
MAYPVKGLQTSIWDNNFRSILLLAAYPFIIAGTLLLCAAAWGYFAGSGTSYSAYPGASAPSVQSALQFGWAILLQYWPVILTIVSIWFMIAYFFQNAMIRSLSHSHPVTRKQEPELYNLLENLCIAQGMKMPRLEIIETHARNAFASGVNDSTYCVTVTRGLMQSLSKDELEGVLAHELAHIINRDVRLLMICVIFTGMLGLAAQLVWSNARYAIYVPRSNNRNGGSGYILLLVIGVILGIGYFASMFARFAISRRREYMADAGAVQMTRNPDAMMRALIRISGAADIPKMPDDVRAMCFENKHAFLGLLATHPPITSRVQAISEYSGLPVPNLRPKLRADDNDAFARPAQPGERDNWTTRQRFSGRRNKNPWM